MHGVARAMPYCQARPHGGHSWLKRAAGGTQANPRAPPCLGEYRGIPAGSPDGRSANSATDHGGDDSEMSLTLSS